MHDVPGLPRQWRKPLGGLLFIILAIVVMFWGTWQSIVDIWMRSETYTHGFLVAPISLWLIWSRWANYRYQRPTPGLSGLLLVLACGFLWMSADLIHALVVQQWAVVGILVASVWTVLGNRTTYSMLFPLLFLFMMVPFGEDFVPGLMEFTATFVVGMLRLTGISVYREGLHFSLTTGNWSVIDACSGIRYLIASITLGLVYMYLNYTSYKKRMLFMLVAVLLPILANGLRGYMIVMIGHLSDMKLATGVDHLIYGWLFFGLVMLLLFYIGSFWHDPPVVVTVETAMAPQDAEIGGYPLFRPVIPALLGCLLIWPVTSLWLAARQGAHVEIPAQFARSPDDSRWQAVAMPAWGWQPDFKGVVNYDRRFFSDGSNIIGLYAGNFGAEAEGELVNSQNNLVSRRDAPWRVLNTGKSSVALANGRQLDFDTSILDNGGRQLLAYRWYRVGATSTTNGYTAKLLQLFKRLSGDTSAELLVVLYTGTTPADRDEAAGRLQKFAAACCS